MERLLTRKLVDEITEVGGNGAPVTSVYLGTEGSAGGKQQLISQFKDLVNSGGVRLYEGRSHNEKSSIKSDMSRITGFLASIRKVDVRGLAMFSCSGNDVFETLGVSMPFRPHLIVDSKPAVAPLLAALDEFRRIAVCVVDRRDARLYEYFMGRMEEIASFVDEVPARVRVAGWGGYEESRIARHIASHEYEHYKNVAEALFQEFKLRGFDWLFLGVRPELRDDFERALHSYVSSRLKGFIDATYKTSLSNVRKTTMGLAEELKIKDNVRLVEKLVAAAKSGNHAVVGVRDTFKALNMAAAGRLVVRGGLSRGGVLCRACGCLGLKSRNCPLCGGRMSAVEDAIGVAEEIAAASGVEIKHVSCESPLDDFEGIGAFLRFPLSK